MYITKEMRWRLLYTISRRRIAYCWDIFAPFSMHYAVWMIRNQAVKLRDNFQPVTHRTTDSKLVIRILFVGLQTFLRPEPKLA